MTVKRKTYGIMIPEVNLDKLTGTLVVIEGPDSSGRSTQIKLLTDWLEQKGHPCVVTGLKRSNLVAEELDQARMGNVLSPRTLSLFYATDFADQMENTIIPALRAGFIVLADRYIYTLMARDIVRGADPDWVSSVYSMALVPDAVFFLSVSLANTLERALADSHTLSYWESGMDMRISRDWYESFTRYQRKLRLVFKKLSNDYDFQVINGNRSVRNVFADVKTRVKTLLKQEII